MIKICFIGTISYIFLMVSFIMPGFYFHNKQRELGNAAKNEENYELALAYYQQALTDLNHQRARKNFVESLYTRNDLASVLSDIIECSAHLAEVSLEEWDIQQITHFRQEVMAHLEKMISVDNELSLVVQNDMHARRRKQKIYSVLADVAEDMSDRVVDLSEQTQGEECFLIALAWLDDALQYRKALELPVKMLMHLGYLNVLELAFKAGKNKDFLVQITDYIERNNLDLRVKYYSVIHLELLSYQLLVAVEQNHQKDAAELVREYRAILKIQPNLKKEEQIVNDIAALIQKLEQSHAMQTNPPKKRRRVIEEDEDELIIDQERMKQPKLHEDNPEAQHLLASEQQEQSTPLPILQTAVSHSFFAKKSSSPAPVLAQHSQAFAYAMQQVAKKHSHPEFLAKLLSFMAHFYLYPKYCPQEIEVRKAQLIAYSMYSDALVINAKCMDSSKHQAFIAASLHAPIPKLRYLNKNNSLHYFNQTIDNHCVEVGVFLGESKSEEIFASLFQHMVNYIAKQIEKNFADAVIKILYEEYFTHLDNANITNCL